MNTAFCVNINFFQCRDHPPRFDHRHYHLQNIHHRVEFVCLGYVLKQQVNKRMKCCRQEIEEYSIKLWKERISSLLKKIPVLSEKKFVTVIRMIQRRRRTTGNRINNKAKYQEPSDMLWLFPSFFSHFLSRYRHDESLNTQNKGKFLSWPSDRYSLWNEKVWKVANQNAPGNNQMNFPYVQKELANTWAAEITRAIVDDIGDNYFFLMIDEARDVSLKKEIEVVQRYLNNDGYVIELFLAVIDVPDTLAISLKNAIGCRFAKHELSLPRRIQWFEGTHPKRKSIYKICPLFCSPISISDCYCC